MECIPPGLAVDTLTWCEGIDQGAFTAAKSAKCILGSLTELDFARRCCTREQHQKRFCGGFDCRFYNTYPCCDGTTSLLFPLGINESTWSGSALAVACAIFLAWMFVGVAHAADAFMQAVELITTEEREVFSKKTHKLENVRVWNATLANISLMAIGSSAPEILLSIMELFSNDYFSGELGPFTIIGSASFNLFVISAICILAIPEDEVRRIHEVPVYITTSIFSIAAYMWIVITLVYISPDVVEKWEALLTIAFFFIFLMTSYMADIGLLSRFFRFCIRRKSAQVLSDTPDEILASKIEDSATVVPGQQDKHNKSAELKDKYGNNISRETFDKMQKWVHKYSEVKKSRAYYRSSIRMKSKSNVASTIHQMSPITGIVIDEDEVLGKSEDTDAYQAEIVEFETPHYPVLESEGNVVIQVHRSGDCQSVLKVRYRTEDGSAKAGDDYVAVSGELVFNHRQSMKTLIVPIIDDDEHEPEEEFHVVLFDARSTVKCQIGEVCKTTVTIIDDDEPGVLHFEIPANSGDEDVPFIEEIVPMVHRNGEVLTSAGTVRTKPNSVALVEVRRIKGNTAKVSCSWSCFCGSASPGIHYLQTEGRLEFQAKEVTKFISIPIMDVEEDVYFNVICSDPRGGVAFHDKNESIMCQVYISAPPCNELSPRLSPKWNEAEKAHMSWEMQLAVSVKEQLWEAIYVNGSREEQAGASVFDWFLHVISLPWKFILAAFSPPAKMGGGWCRFVMSLIFIAAQTAVINDSAKLLGCFLGIRDADTAITLLALGTSLPDTFASVIAAQDEPTADAAIGNINGSNAVNVFLGLGISWTIGSFYWDYEGANEVWKSRYFDLEAKQGFAQYPNDSLVYSVSAFTFGAVITISLLRYRRFKYGGELGGPYWSRRISAALCVLLWLFYIVFSSLMRS